ncbi:hypothetical protein D7Y27_10630, partial [Corallococcus sp. AB004]
MDSQSVKAPEEADSRGYDAGKQVKGRKRHLLVEVLPRASEDFPSLNKVWADARYQGPVVADAAKEAGLELEIVRRSEEDRGFVVQKRRWVVVRTNAWLMRQRRLARDDERPERTEWMGKGGSGPHLRGPGRGHGTSRDPALPDA